MDTNNKQYNAPLKGMALGMAYVPPQEWDNIYDSDVGFYRGTIFQELDKPFIGEEAVNSDR